MMVLCMIHQRLMSLYGFWKLNAHIHKEMLRQQRLVGHQDSATAPQ